MPAEYAAEVLLGEHIVLQAFLLGLELLVALLELQLLLHGGSACAVASGRSTLMTAAAEAPVEV